MGAKTTNILDLNNRLEKVEKENVQQNSYTSLKNKPKINNVTLTGNKSLADIGAAAAADLTTLAGDVGDVTELSTTIKTSTVAAINEVNSYVLANNGNSAIDISAYDYSNQYTFPSDGYVTINTGLASTGDVDIRLTGNNGVGLAYYKVNSVSPDTFQSIYVKKGMKSWVSSNISNSKIEFRAIT